MVGISSCGTYQLGMLTIPKSGPISSLTVLGKHVIVLNDAKLAVQLLEKRSAIHSGRPENMFVDMSVEGIM
mgnify:FL=1|jgi:hypothetical protein